MVGNLLFLLVFFYYVSKLTPGDNLRFVINSSINCGIALKKVSLTSEVLSMNWKDQVHKLRLRIQRFFLVERNLRKL